MNQLVGQYGGMNIQGSITIGGDTRPSAEECHRKMVHCSDQLAAKRLAWVEAKKGRDVAILKMKTASLELRQKENEVLGLEKDQQTLMSDLKMWAARSDANPLQPYVPPAPTPSTPSTLADSYAHVGGHADAAAMNRASYLAALTADQREAVEGDEAALTEALAFVAQGRMAEALAVAIVKAKEAKTAATMAEAKSTEVNAFVPTMRLSAGTATTESTMSEAAK